jgi:hypothetical protein
MAKIKIASLMLTTALWTCAPAPAQDMPTSSPAKDEPKTWTLHAGIGSPKAWNFVGVSKEYLLDDHTAFFITGGLGTALIGAGMVYYGQREGNGMVVSSAIGLVDLQATLAYQFKLGPQDYLAMGAGYGVFFMQCTCWLPVLSYEHRY